MPEQGGSAPGNTQPAEQGGMVKAAKAIGSALGKAASIVGVKTAAARTKTKPSAAKRKATAGKSAKPRAVGKVDLSKRSKKAGKAGAKKSGKRAGR